MILPFFLQKAELFIHCFKGISVCVWRVTGRKIFVISTSSVRCPCYTSLWCSNIGWDDILLRAVGRLQSLCGEC